MQGSGFGFWVQGIGSLKSGLELTIYVYIYIFFFFLGGGGILCGARFLPSSLG